MQSPTRTTQYESRIPQVQEYDEERTNKFHPRSKLQVEFLISKSLLQSLQSDGRFTAHIMPMSLEYH